MSSVFLFSDLHTSTKHLSKMYDFVTQNKNITAIVSAGDIVNMGEPVWFMDKFIEILDELALPFLWAPGNNDFGRAYHKLNSKYKSLEGRVEEFDGRNFTGVGGSPASWSGQYAGKEIIDRKKIGGSIFVSHFPPPGILNYRKHDIPTPLLAGHSERNEESKRSFTSAQNNTVNCKLKIENLAPERRFSDSPLVHICGHLHYRWGTSYLGQTKIIQLASLETGHYAILDLENLSVEFDRF